MKGVPFRKTAPRSPASHVVRKPALRIQSRSPAQKPGFLLTVIRRIRLVFFQLQKHVRVHVIDDGIAPVAPPQKIDLFAPPAAERVQRRGRDCIGFKTLAADGAGGRLRRHRNSREQDQLDCTHEKSQGNRPRRAGCVSPLMRQSGESHHP